MLYNHIWHNDLDECFINEIYKNDAYLHIIKHKNFNPRLIEFITSARSLYNVKAKNYFQFIDEQLTNPALVWKNYFNVQNNEYLRGMVALLVFSGSNVNEDIFRKSFSSLMPYLQKLSQVSTNQPLNFNKVITEATGAFINRVINSDSKVTISVFNPSINDYVFKEYADAPEYLASIFNAIGTITPYKILFDLIKDEKYLTHQLRS